MTDLIAELAEVVRLGIAASNDEPWQVDAEGDIVCNGEQVAWPITNKLDAPYIAALNNWFRTHHATLTRILTDDAAIRAAHHDLVIRLGEVTTELEAARKDARGERDETWEVWQDDMPVAVSDSFPDAMHYLAMYQQDGPVTLMRAVVYRETITPEQLAAMKESGK